MEGDNGALSGTGNDGDLHFVPFQCLGTQEPHQSSRLPMLAMEGMESLPLNSP